MIEPRWQLSFPFELAREDGRYGGRPRHGAAHGQPAYREPIADDAEIVAALSERLAEFGVRIMAEGDQRTEKLRRLTGPEQ